MVTPEEQLELADPFAGAPYARDDLAAMLARIRAATPSEGHRIGRTPRQASARVLLGVAVVAGLILAGVYGFAPSTSTAGALDVVARLGQQHVSFVHTPPAPLGWSSGAIFGERPPRSYAFKPGPDLSRVAGSGNGYLLVPPASAAVATEHVARLLGLSGSAVGHGGRTPRWSVGATTGPRAWYQVQAGVPIFGYTRSACELGAVLQGDGVGCPAHPWRPHSGELAQARDTLTRARLDALAQRFVRRLHLGYGIDLAQPNTYGPKGVDPVYQICRHACIYRNTYFWILVGGVPDGQGIGLSFDQRGTIVAATGPAFSVGAPTTYSLLSAAAGVGALDRTHPTQEDIPGLLFEDFGRCHAARCRIRALPPWPPGHGILHASSLGQSIYLLKDGSLMALPTFTYTDATSYNLANHGIHGPVPARSGPLQGMWYQLAVVPADVHYPAPV